jgi:hypothetical protein
MNILTALIKNCEATTSPAGVSDTCLDDLREYARKLGESVKRFEARRRTDVLTAGGKKEWAQARQVSMETNLVRYKVRVPVRNPCVDYANLLPRTALAGSA